MLKALLEKGGTKSRSIPRVEKKKKGRLRTGKEGEKAALRRTPRHKLRRTKESSSVAGGKKVPFRPSTLEKESTFSAGGKGGKGIGPLELLVLNEGEKGNKNNGGKGKARLAMPSAPRTSRGESGKGGTRSLLLSVYRPTRKAETPKTYPILEGRRSSPRHGEGGHSAGGQHVRLFSARKKGRGKPTLLRRWNHSFGPSWLTHTRLKWKRNTLPLEERGVAAVISIGENHHSSERGLWDFA